MVIMVLENFKCQESKNEIGLKIAYKTIYFNNNNITITGLLWIE